MLPKASLKPDAVLQNQYKILGRLNEGGMGTVYKGRDLNFREVNRLVAIKEMHLGDTSLTATMVQIFRREANLLATLSHPAMPRIYSFFEQNDRVYLVMEFINGVDLDKIMDKAVQHYDRQSWPGAAGGFWHRQSDSGRNPA
jgi:serine/threonine protein kinase